MISFLQWSFVVCFVYFVLLNTYHAIFLFFSWIEHKLIVSRSKTEDLEPVTTSNFTIPVSIVIPAYNEEKLVIDTVYSALQSEYPQFEVIVVNDGSTDGTLKVLQKEFALTPVTLFYRKQIPTETVLGIFKSNNDKRLIVVDKVNGQTHADAANAGINVARYRYVLCVDADTLLEKDALLKAIRVVLKDPAKVVGVGSTVGISNGFQVDRGKISKYRFSNNLLVNLQVLEYLRAFFVNRLGWSRKNQNMCVSGAFSLWRRDILVENGGLKRDFSCDDLELTFRIHEKLRREKTPYQICSLPDAVCWTEVPSTTKELYLQRHRWQRVTNECTWHYKKMLFNPRYGTVGMWGMAYFLFAEVIGPVLELFSYLTVPLAYFYGVLDPYVLGLFLLCSAGLNALISLVSIILFDISFPKFSAGNLLRLCLASLVEFLGYRPVLAVSRMAAIFSSITGRKRKWNKLERVGYAAA